MQILSTGKFSRYPVLVMQRNYPGPYALNKARRAAPAAQSLRRNNRESLAAQLRVWGAG